MNRASICGLVLAGGRSRRFGREKAAAALHGRTLIEAALAVLDTGCTAAAVNAPAGGWAARFAEAQGRTRLADAPGDPDGPLAGVRAGLAWAAAQGAGVLATVPCDTPRLPLDLVARLAEKLGEAPAAVARTAAGVHPLCAVWRIELEPRLAGALAGEHPPVGRWLASMGAREVAFDDEAAFFNINHAADLDAAERMSR